MHHAKADTIFTPVSFKYLKSVSDLKKLFFIPLCCITIAAVISWLPSKNDNHPVRTVISADSLNNLPESEAATLYSELELEQKGLNKQAFEYAYKGYLKLVRKHIIKRTDLLTICDFSQSSSKKRLYVIDLDSNEVVINTYVAHGRNSGAEYATRFSNKPSSLQSSLGFYITQNTYFGEHGLSLKVAGLEAGFNDKAYRRAIVIHGADYIGNKWLNNNNYMGRSFGCPAVPEKEKVEIINTIKNGSCLFIYHPTKNYLKGSRILNG